MLQQLPQSSAVHECDQLIALFDQTFFERNNTRLVRGEGEPIYLPADSQCSCHRVVFAHGFFRSALHEVAHWCIAGQERRLLEDYGYWYEPDGRSMDQQRLFESVEVEPQALEWIFAKAANHSFCVSVDNLSGAATDAMPFKRAVLQQVRVYCEQGLPVRPAMFREALVSQFHSDKALCAEQFSLDEL